MTMTQASLKGLAKGFLGLLDENAPLFVGTPIDVPKVRKIVSDKLEVVVQKDARQEHTKVALRESTVEVNAANADLQRTVSGWLDAVIGAVGKGSPAAKNFQRLRSRIRMPDREDAATTVETTLQGPK